MDETKWRVAPLSKFDDPALYRQIIAHFKEIYEAAGEPEGVGLFETFGALALASGGPVHGDVRALVLTPATTPFANRLFEESEPWEEYEFLPSMFRPLSWCAGDPASLKNTNYG